MAITLSSIMYNSNTTVHDHGTTSGAVTFDLSNGDYHKMTLNGNITGITISNTPSGSWGIMIEAINWGGYTIALGSIEVAGGAGLSLTTTGTDKLVLSGEGSNASIGLSQEDIS